MVSLDNLIVTILDLFIVISTNEVYILLLKVFSELFCWSVSSS